LGIARARGAIILRMDAHCEYPPGYIPALVDALAREQADNVGGITEVLPAGDGAVPRAIAIAMAHPAAVGNSWFRIGTSEPRWVDTVPFGCWRRETFLRVGGFDESLPRNQDDEFNMRLRRAGGRILLLPSVVTRYYARATLGQLARMFWQYGYYKPLTAIRAGAPLRPRQFAPAALLLALIAGAIAAPFTAAGAVCLAAVLAAYLLFVTAAAIPAVAKHGVAVALALAAAIVTMHLSYGAGFLRGAWRFAILRRAPAPAAPKLSR
ncbi:MAG TPA: glycosyltransferase, partial [Gemmatimonadaceae bacterium]|nr:glycosyltransferase [Gemmatimonadaceae bacterium]